VARTITHIPTGVMRNTTSGEKKEHLGVELDEGRAEAHEAGEEGLVEVAVLLEGHVLDHGRQLVVVAYQDHPLQPRHAILLVLRIVAGEMRQLSLVALISWALRSSTLSYIFHIPT
jgi:hypothetical protein